MEVVSHRVSRVRPSVSSTQKNCITLDELPTVSTSLLKYHIPQLVTGRKVDLRSKGTSTTTEKRPSLRRQSEATVKETAKSIKTTKQVGSASRPNPDKTCSLEEDSTKDVDSDEVYTQDLLDALFPLREFRLRCGNVYHQRVSAAPATRLDVLAVHDQLIKELQRRRAKECGVCPIREELYSDCFNEVIRQVAVGCAERGKLLHVVKREVEDTKEAYKSLYNSVTKFGLRKALSEEQKAAREREEIKQLEAEISELEKEENQLQSEYEEIHRKAQADKAEENAIHNKKVSLLKSSINTVQERIELFLSVQTIS
ncbi:axonemal dynein light intermediate polypeptide 1-like [Condylostylus longicornis]|uniref:axonemal dynein light intermediate polypeptide 1-like n=1 Tax=Condylostylus longicornis TaxID=2530218 RepID=UPI00244E2527|nr:axonemal dynein light intermediate polypeptide 1-like [Condylostylus longicornis]